MLRSYVARPHLQNYHSQINIFLILAFSYKIWIILGEQFFQQEKKKKIHYTKANRQNYGWCTTQNVA